MVERRTEPLDAAAAHLRLAPRADSPGNHARRRPRAACSSEIVALARERPARPDRPHRRPLRRGCGRLYERSTLGARHARSELAAVAPVVVLAGNHDSPALFGLPEARSAARRGSTSSTGPARRRTAAFSTSRCGRQRLRLAPLPFVHPNRLVDASRTRRTWTAPTPTASRDIERRAGRRVCSTGTTRDRDVLLFAAHLHVTGARFSQQRARAPRLATATRPGSSTLPAGLLRRVRPHPSPADRSRDRGARPLRRLADPARLRRGGRQQAGGPGRARAGSTGARAADRARERSAAAPFHGHARAARAGAPSIGDEICLVTVDVPDRWPTSPTAWPRSFPTAVVVHVEERSADRRLAPRKSSTSGAEEPTLVEHFRAYLEAQGTRARPPTSCSAGSLGSTRRWRLRRSRPSPRNGLLLDDEEPVVASERRRRSPEQMQLAGIDAPEPAPRRRRRR